MGNATSIIFTIQGALHKSVDSITIIVLKSCSENSCQHDMGEEDSRRVDLLEDRTTHGMRHRTISRVETRVTHQEAWKETDDEGALGRQ